jgi:hypothetical protein
MNLPQKRRRYAPSTPYGVIDGLGYDSQLANREIKANAGWIFLSAQLIFK